MSYIRARRKWEGVSTRDMSFSLIFRSNKKKYLGQASKWGDRYRIHHPESLKLTDTMDQAAYVIQWEYIEYIKKYELYKVSE